MPDIAGQLGSAADAFFSSEAVRFVLYSTLLYLFVAWLAAAYWAFRDMHDRTENRALPYVAAALILAPSPLLFVFGVIIYRVIRPAERLGDVYERNLAEEALLAEVEAVKTCRNCDKRVNEEWIICPWCRTRLNRVCPNCERLVGLDWTLCAWCGKDFERPVAVERTVPETSPSVAYGSLPGAGVPERPSADTIANRKPVIGG
jgi:RNA polymerase subunit RPABC4/transcription elongation factor Spt4